MATDHTASTWAEGVRRLVEEDFPQAQRITLVLDNLSMHSGASLYKSFSARQGARVCWTSWSWCTRRSTAVG